jgi:peptidoglycan hydrolase-like protein with peptidoglycan-binding domain
MYLLDTIAHKEFIIKEFKTKHLVQEGGHTEWQEVVCENKVRKSLILEIQTKLEEKGFNIGVLGPTGDLDFVTRKIIADYQREYGLPIGGLNIETLESLNISY